MTKQFLYEISEKHYTCIKFINPEHLLLILYINLNRKVKNIGMVSDIDAVCDTILCPYYS